MLFTEMAHINACVRTSGVFGRPGSQFESAVPDLRDAPSLCHAAHGFGGVDSDHVSTLPDPTRCQWQTHTRAVADDQDLVSRLQLGGVDGPLLLLGVAACHEVAAKPTEKTTRVSEGWVQDAHHQVLHALSPPPVNTPGDRG